MLKKVDKDIVVSVRERWFNMARVESLEFRVGLGMMFHNEGDC